MGTKTTSIKILKGILSNVLGIIFSILFFCNGSVNAQTNPQGFYLDNWRPKTIVNPSYISVSPTSSNPTVTVTVDPGQQLTKVSKYIYGHNAGAWNGKIEQNTLLLQGIQDLKPQIIRWPGGNLSNTYFWDAQNQATCPKDLPPNFVYADLSYGANKNGWTTPLDSYYNLLSTTNSDGSICVNYAYARYGTSKDPVASAAHYAAEWVRYDKGRTKYWEIGNEDYGKWEAGYSIDQTYNKDGQPAIINGDLYGKHCRVFIDSMRAAAKEIGADIKIGIVVRASDVTYADPTKDWNKGVIPQAASKADFLIVHKYMANSAEKNPTNILTTAVQDISSIKNLINSQLKSFANLPPMPLALTEWNINSVGLKQEISYINGIHGALVQGELIKNGYGQANRWDFLNGYNNGDSHGLFASGETDATPFSPRAPFFYMYYFQKFFGDKMVNSTVTGSPDVVSYASTFSSGQSGVVLVNKGATSQVANLQFKNFNPGDQYYYYVLTGGTDNGDFSRKVLVNGASTTEAGGGPSNYSTLKPYASKISGGSIKIELPKYSVIYLLVENSLLKTQTINFPSIPQKYVGDADFNAGATASSGLLITYSSSDTSVAKIINGKIHIISVGTTVIMATQNGNTTYSKAIPVKQNLVVSSKPAPEINIKQGNTDVLNSVGNYNFISPISVGKTSAAITFTIQNTGNANLSVNSISIKGINPLQFTITQSSSSSIGGMHTATFTVQFKPTTAGVKSAIISIDNNDSNENPYTFTVSGTAVLVKDCAGIVNGTATIDVCGTCVGGTTGKTTLDTDKDGLANCIDPDMDNDGVANADDCAPLNPSVKGKTIWYSDIDGDGYGDPLVKVLACVKPVGYVSVTGDNCPTDPTKIVPGNCGCNKPETSCNLLEINGPDCAVPLEEVKFSLNLEEKINATNYHWWFGGAAATITPTADGSSCTIKLSKYFGTGQVCVGVNYKSAPYYKTYCKHISHCSPMDVATIASPAIAIYPNPCSADNVTIDASSYNEIPNRIEVSNSYGKIILDTYETNLQTVLSVTDLPTGTYSVKSYFNENIDVQKLLIIK